MPTDRGASGRSRLGEGDPASPARTEDWASFLTAKIESVVSVIRDKAVSPVSAGVHYAIFALVAGAILSILVVLFAVAVVRFFDVEVSIAGAPAGHGRGRTKKQAEQEAARDALGRLDKKTEDIA